MKQFVEPIKSKEDLKKIIECLYEKSIMYSTIFQVGIYSGLRVSDILRLDTTDVINRDFIEIKEKKTGKYKKFPIKSQLKKVLDEYLIWRNENRQGFFSAEDALFIGIRHCRICRSQVYREINEAAKKAGLTINVGTHTMRKTFGYHHYQQFHDVALLQKIFNHSSSLITLRYIGIYQEEINESYNSFDYFTQDNRHIPEKTLKLPDNSKFLTQIISLLEQINQKLNGVSKTEQFLQNYLKTGDKKYRGFAQLALEGEIF